MLAFGLVGGFFVARFGVLPWTERFSILMMLSIASISYYTVVRDAGFRWVIFLLLSGLLALWFEYAWVQYCIPYGCFVYGDVLGVKIWNTVPRTVFIGRTPLIIWVYAILRKYVHNAGLLIILWAILLTLIDMVLDPGAVLLGFWSFDAGGWYYNIPWSNFLGWLVSGWVGMVLATVLLKNTNNNIQRTYSAGLTLSFFTFIAFWSGMMLPTILWFLLLCGYFIYLQTH